MIYNIINVHCVDILILNNINNKYNKLKINILIVINILKNYLKVNKE